MFSYKRSKDQDLCSSLSVFALPPIVSLLFSWPTRQKIYKYHIPIKASMKKPLMISYQTEERTRLLVRMYSSKFIILIIYSKDKYHLPAFVSPAKDDGDVGGEIMGCWVGAVDRSIIQQRKKFYENPLCIILVSTKKISIKNWTYHRSYDLDQTLFRYPLLQSLPAILTKGSPKSTVNPSNPFHDESIEKMDQYYDLNKILKTKGFFFTDGLFWDGWCKVVEVGWFDFTMFVQLCEISTWNRSVPGINK